MEAIRKTVTFLKYFKGNLFASHIQANPFLLVPQHLYEAYYLEREYRTGTSLRGTDI